MDRRTIVNRLSKLFYLRKEPFAICANRLLRFGYQDIEIDIPICENSRESKEYCAEIRKMTINFRHQNYQYHVEAQCADGYAFSFCRYLPAHPQAVATGVLLCRLSRCLCALL